MTIVQIWHPWSPDLKRYLEKKRFCKNSKRISVASLVGENVDCCHCSEGTGDVFFKTFYINDMIHSSQALLRCLHLQDESSLEAHVGSNRIPLRLWDSGPAFDFFFLGAFLRI